MTDDKTDNVVNFPIRAVEKEIDAANAAAETPAPTETVLLPAMNPDAEIAAAATLNEQQKAQAALRMVDFMACFGYSHADHVSQVRLGSCPLGPVLMIECIVKQSEFPDHQFRTEHTGAVLVESWDNSRIQSGETISDTDEWVRSNTLHRLVTAEELEKVKAFQAKWNLADDGTVKKDLPAGTVEGPATIQ